MQADPSNSAAYYNLALLLRETGNTAEANQMFAKAQQLDPKLVPPATAAPTAAPTAPASGTPRPSASPTR